MSPLRLLLAMLAILCAIGAASTPLLLWRLSRRTGFEFRSGLRESVVASDVGVGAPLLVRDDQLGLCGKPDYLIESDESGRRLLMPMEIKPSRRSERLYESDRVQIGAYLVALRATAKNRASPIGYVRYESRTFEVALTADLGAMRVRSVRIVTTRSSASIARFARPRNDLVTLGEGTLCISYRCATPHVKNA